MNIEAMFFFVPAFVFSIFAAYYSMKIAAHRRYLREERQERIERAKQKAAK